MTTNFLTGIIGIVVGGIYLITALQLPQMRMGDRLGPKLFPAVVGIAAIIAGLALIIQDKRPGKASKKADFGFVKYKPVWIKIALTSAVGILFGLFIDSLGFVLATSLFMLFATSLINKGRHVQNIVISILFSVITYGVFGLALKLSLPRGIIENILPF
ncbi:MAG: tripartite tricarboxylate transporter TctB family protein [Candidatus Kryptoniota bacterium]